MRQHYVDEGAGDPVVMVHGNPTWSFYFRALIADLGRDHRVIAPDHVGCGLSDKPDDEHYEYTLRRRVDDLERLLDQAGVRERVTLLLHDWGGMIGMAWATRHPERVRRLVVLNTAAFRLPPTKPLPLSLRLCRSPLGPLLVRGLNLFCRGALGSCAKHRLAPEVRAAYLAPYDSWAHRIGVLRFVQDIPLRPGHRAYDIVRGVEERLDQFRDRPMLRCWGRQDFVFDDHFLAEWRRRFPQAEEHVFEDAGHYVLEDAADRIVPLVRGFLERHPL